MYISYATAEVVEDVGAGQPEGLDEVVDEHRIDLAIHLLTGRSVAPEHLRVIFGGHLQDLLPHRLVRRERDEFLPHRHRLSCHLRSPASSLLGRHTVRCLNAVPSRPNRPLCSLPLSTSGSSVDNAHQIAREIPSHTDQETKGRQRFIRFLISLISFLFFHRYFPVRLHRTTTSITAMEASGGPATTDTDMLLATEGTVTRPSRALQMHRDC
jgi:hypothetical protein